VNAYLFRNYGFYYLALNDKILAKENFQKAVLLDYKLERELKKQISDLEIK